MRLSPAQRRAFRKEEERKSYNAHQRRAAYYKKHVALRPARCNDCGATTTAQDMAKYSRREVSVNNQCQQCFDKELEQDHGYETEFPGERIYWKTNP